MSRKFSIADPGENDFTPVLVGVAGLTIFYLSYNYKVVRHQERQLFVKIL